jgi:hypothetical protein
MSIHAAAYILEEVPTYFSPHAKHMRECNKHEAHRSFSKQSAEETKLHIIICVPMQVVPCVRVSTNMIHITG